MFFPQIEGDEVSAKIVMPVGTPFDETRQAINQLEAAAQKVADNIKGDIYQGVSTTVGYVVQDTGPATSGSRAASNTGQVRLKLVDAGVRPMPATEVEDKWRTAVGNIPGVEELSFESSLVKSGADVTLELSHTDPDKLQNAIDDLKAMLSETNGLTEITVYPKPGKKEYVFELTQTGLAAGLTPQDLGSHLRSAFYGFEVQRIQRRGEEVKVMVRYPEADRDSLETLQTTRIRLQNGEAVPLNTVATITQQTGYSSIARASGQRVITIEMDTIKSILTPDAAINRIFDTYVPALQKNYPDINVILEGESRKRQEDLNSLKQNMLIGLMIIFVMLGGLLRSYSQPIIILAVVPFGIVGAVAGHLLLGFNMTFISMFGIVALTGVIVNDSVVMIDYFNKQRRAGEGIQDAMLQAIQRRFRPILLTTMTTVFGLLPILLETSLQARFLIPMVVSLAFGLIFGTLIIMILVPVLTTIVDDIRRGGRQLIKKVKSVG